MLWIDGEQKWRGISSDDGTRRGRMRSGTAMHVFPVWAPAPAENVVVFPLLRGYGKRFFFSRIYPLTRKDCQDKNSAGVAEFDRKRCIVALTRWSFGGIPPWTGNSARFLAVYLSYT